MSLKRSRSLQNNLNKHARYDSVRCYYEIYKEDDYVICDAGFVVGIGETLNHALHDLKTKAIHMLSVIGKAINQKHMLEGSCYVDICWTEVEVHKKEFCIYNI